MSSTIPLVDISRTPSPYPRSRTGSATQSEDEDDYTVPASLRPLVRDHGLSSKRSVWKRTFLDGGLGGFLLSTWSGLQVYVGILIFAAAGCEFALVVVNRLILMTGVYKFPYPLTATWVQLVITHLFFLLAASLTRLLNKWLTKAGLGAAVAPSRPLTKRPGALQLAASRSRWSKIPFVNAFDGIEGGGIFEFDPKIARKCLFLAVVFTGKIILSNISFAYAVLPVYTLSRVGVTPTTLLLTALLTRTNHSVPVLSAALTSTFTLLFASIRHGSRVTWESILAGAWSTIFVSLYPILLVRTSRVLASISAPFGAGPSADELLDFDDSHDEAFGGRGTPNPHHPRPSSVAYWRVLHYVSLLSIAILTPLVLLSGELGNIRRNCYFLDVPWFWFLTGLGGLSSFGVFVFYFLLVKATSPLSANFVGVPRAAFQLSVFGGKMPAHAWVGVGVCWASSLWYAFIKRSEARSRGKSRLEGR